MARKKKISKHPAPEAPEERVAGALARDAMQAEDDPTVNSPYEEYAKKSGSNDGPPNSQGTRSR